MKKVKLAVIGLRGFGKAHLDGICGNKNAELMAVCDLDGEIAEQRAKEFGIKDYYTDYKELLKRDDIEAITIATNDQSHEELTVACLFAGKHVLCEKPMALSVPECIRMIEAAEKSGKKLMVGQVCRYAPSFRKAKHMVECGEIGELYYVESEYAHDYSKLKAATWRFDPESPRSPVTGGGCHAVDLLRWIAGDPIETFSYSNQKVLTDWPVNDSTIAVMKFPNNVMGKVYVSIGCRRYYTMRTVLYGTKGTIIVDNRSPYMSIYKEGFDEDEFYYDVDRMELETRIPVPINHHNIVGEVGDFCDCIINDKPVITDGYEGASTVAVCEAIIKSSEIGEKVLVDYSFKK